MKVTSAKLASVSGFSVVELLISLIISLIIVAGAAAMYSTALRTREREGGRVDAITAAQAALSVMSREIGNSGYGLYQDNGLVLGDCTGDKIRFRANIDNVNPSGNGANTSQPGEDVMYLFDSGSASVVRFDRNAPNGVSTGVTSGIINRVSNVDFIYHNYALDGSGFVSSTTPVANTTHITARVTINLYISLPPVAGQPNRIERVSSDVTLRNAPYMLGQY